MADLKPWARCATGPLGRGVLTDQSRVEPVPSEISPLVYSALYCSCSPAHSAARQSTASVWVAEDCMATSHGHRQRQDLYLFF